MLPECYTGYKACESRLEPVDSEPMLTFFDSRRHCHCRAHVLPGLYYRRRVPHDLHVRLGQDDRQPPCVLSLCCESLFPPRLTLPLPPATAPSMAEEISMLNESRGFPTISRAITRETVYRDMNGMGSTKS